MIHMREFIVDKMGFTADAPPLEPEYDNDIDWAGKLPLPVPEYIPTHYMCGELEIMIYDADLLDEAYSCLNSSFPRAVSEFSIECNLDTLYFRWNSDNPPDPIHIRIRDECEMMWKPWDVLGCFYGLCPYAPRGNRIRWRKDWYKYNVKEGTVQMRRSIVSEWGPKVPAWSDFVFKSDPDKE
ncbi:hypothetical protein DXG01_000919 [Tephrocybe rancida]|nr:hypothetical protein DXG01_000919 [Tephrocybe rancida]